MKVNFVDLRAQHDEVRPEIEAAIADIIDRSSFVGGPYVAGFEKAFAEYIGVKEAIAVGNGTDALWLALQASGVKPGEAVVTVPNTFIATVEAIMRAGAHPLFVDIDLETSNMDPEALKMFLEERCTVEDNGDVIHQESGWAISTILPVHLYGQPAQLSPLKNIADHYDLILVEDAAQAQGARYNFDGLAGRAGSFGHASGFSFYPGKNLGAMGEGGAVVTNDPEVAEKIRILRDHGSNEKYIHNTPHGWNARLDAIQAAVLTIKLKKLDEWNARRRKAASHYHEVLSDLPMELPVDPEYAEQICHLYVVRVEDREDLRVKLLEKDIGVSMHYPIPLHLQKAYEHLGYRKGDFPKAEQSAATLLSLPMHQALTDDQIEYVAHACREILG